MFGYHNSGTAGSTPVTFIASASNETSTSSDTTIVVSKPSGTLSGHLMVAICNWDVGGGAWTGDTGWTEVLDQGTTAPGTRIAWKLAGGSEPTSYTFTTAVAPISLQAFILTFSSAAFDVVGAASANATPSVAPAITVSANGSLLVATYSRSGSSTTYSTPTGMTALVNSTLAPSTAIFTQSVNSGSTGTRSSTPSTGNATGVLFSLSRA